MHTNAAKLDPLLPLEGLGLHQRFAVHADVATGRGHDQHIVSQPFELEVHGLHASAINPNVRTWEGSNDNGSVGARTKLEYMPCAIEF
jgi:hypothetical protein